MQHQIIQYMDKISEHKLLQAVRKGLTLMIPLMMAGSLALLINNFPLPSYQTFMVKIFGETWKNFAEYIYNGTFSIMAIGMLLSISYSLIEKHSAEQGDDAHPLIGSIVALSCFISITKFESGMINIKWLGAVGLFVAIITAFLATTIFLKLYSIKKLHLKIFSDTADPVVEKALKSIFPAILTIVVFSAVHMIFNFFGVDNINSSLYDILKKIFTGGEENLSTSLLFVILSHTFWFFGLHGNNVLEPISESIFVPNLALNQQMVAQGLSPDHIFTKQFFDVFVFLGGSGATICLIIALLIATRRTNTRQIAMISSVPAIFNVNELMIYGIPLVLNVYFLIPFIFLPVILTLTSFAAMYIGLVPLTVNEVNWTSPVILSGYMATNSIAGSVLQVVNLTIGVLAYLPFVNLNEKYKSRENKKALQSLFQAVLHNTGKNDGRITDRRDIVGNLARNLSVSLKEAITNDLLTLEYQPQVSSDGRIYGVEALLRWTHERLGYIPPPVAVQLSDETGQSDALGKWVMNKAFRQISEWNKIGIDIIMSINLCPSQVHSSLITIVDSLIRSSGANPHKIELEVLETTALGGVNTKIHLEQLKKLGVRLAIDDFGMGHSSLMYLKEFKVDTIKLDGSLVKDITTNSTSRDIISAIINLGESADIDVISEFVETKEQRDTLYSLGCKIYQGYLYSPSLKPNNFIEFYKKFNENEKYLK